MELKDSIGLRGHLTVQVLDSDTGKEISKEDKPNLICVNSRLAIIRLLAQQAAHNTDYYRIWSIYVGDSNTAPATNQTDLQGTNKFGKVVTQDISIIAPDTSGIMEMEMTLDSGDHNEQWLKECGLFTQGTDSAITVPPNAEARMLARQIHGEIYKTSGISVKYTWRYQITA